MNKPLCLESGMSAFALNHVIRAFPLRFCILRAASDQNWRWGRPGNEGSLVSRYSDTCIASTPAFSLWMCTADESLIHLQTFSPSFPASVVNADVTHMMKSPRPF